MSITLRLLMFFFETGMFNLLLDLLLAGYSAVFPGGIASKT
jgi:hypothetical protein